jgi:MoxR-like ATPase
VSEAGLGALLQLASGDPAVRARQAPDTTLELSAEAMAAVRARAYAEVTLPAEIIDLLTELRSYLQQTCEPPVYVSGAWHPCGALLLVSSAALRCLFLRRARPCCYADRRLVKAVAMLRVAAYTCGRGAVNEYDTLLLQHVLWQRPEEAERIREWLLQRIVKDRGTQQVHHRHVRVHESVC